jgi:hypothetical protein
MNGLKTDSLTLMSLVFSRFAPIWSGYECVSFPLGVFVGGCRSFILGLRVFPLLFVQLWCLACWFYILGWGCSWLF